MYECFALQTDREPPSGTLLVRKLNLGPNMPLHCCINFTQATQSNISRLINMLT